MGRRSDTLNVLSQHWKHSKAAVTACGTRGRHSERYRGARGLTLHFLLHTRLVPNPGRCLLCSPFNNSPVVHLQIKEECLPKASTADTVSD